MSNAQLHKRLNPPRTHRGKRALEERCPKALENPKKSAMIRTNKTSNLINTVLRDLHKLREPNSAHLQKRNEVRPFEDVSGVEFLCERNDTSLFALGAHNKKRPHNLILGRMFDFHVLDMFELGVNEDTFLSADDFATVINKKGELDTQSVERDAKSYATGSKPALLFQGEGFDQDPMYQNLRNFLVDFFGGQHVRKLNLLGLDHAIVFTLITPENVEFGEGQMKMERPLLLFRHYYLELQQSANPKVPFVHLKEIGPRMDLVLRRHEHAAEEVQRAARHKFDLTRKPKTKNVSLSNTFKQRTGKMFVLAKDQNIDRMKSKRMKPLRKPKGKKPNAGNDTQSQ